jgi:hypothetical protein
LSFGLGEKKSLFSEDSITEGFLEKVVFEPSYKEKGGAG